MIPRLQISFPRNNQCTFWLGREYSPQEGEYLLNHARSGIVMALRAALPKGGRVGVVAYNCHTVANAVVEAGATPVFVDVTEDLHVDVQHLTRLQLDAIVVTNLFGIHNDIEAIRAVLGQRPIIVDNAHGYGLPAEGDFTAYSINQGKFPALGEGGLLMVNNEQYLVAIEQQYTTLPSYSKIQEMKLFMAMLTKAYLHLPWIYVLLTQNIKKHRGKVTCREAVVIRRMAKGVSRMYQKALPAISEQIKTQRMNAQLVEDTLIRQGLANKVWYGDNAFMAIAQTTNIEALQQYCMTCGVETATHFAKAIDWAQQFGYMQDSCPIAEKLTKELVMIPTYKKIKL